MTDELVKRLREPWFTNGCERYQLDAAERIEQLTAERDGLLRRVTDNHVAVVVALCRAEKAEAERGGYRKALERIAGVKGPYSHPFPESNEGYGSFAIVTAREALKGESHE